MRLNFFFYPNKARFAFSWNFSSKITKRSWVPRPITVPFSSFAETEKTSFSSVDFYQFTLTGDGHAKWCWGIM